MICTTHTVSTGCSRIMKVLIVLSDSECLQTYVPLNTGLKTTTTTTFVTVMFPFVCVCVALEFFCVRNYEFVIIYCHF